VIIKEVYFPPEAPLEVATLIESAIVYQNDGNFIQAVDCLVKGKNKWAEILKAESNAQLRKE